MDTSELRRLLEAATPLPWVAECNAEHKGTWIFQTHVTDENGDWIEYDIAELLAETADEKPDWRRQQADRALILGAVNHLPGLLDRLDALEEVDEAAEEIARLRKRVAGLQQENRNLRKRGHRLEKGLEAARRDIDVCAENLRREREEVNRLRRANKAARADVARITAQRDDYALGLDHFTTCGEACIMDLLDKRREEADHLRKHITEANERIRGFLEDGIPIDFTWLEEAHEELKAALDGPEVTP